MDDSELSFEAKRKRFIKENGGLDAARRMYRDGEPLKWYLLPTGARIPALDPMVQHLPPPTNEVERLELIHEYRCMILHECKQDILKYQNAVQFFYSRASFKGIYNGPSTIGGWIGPSWNGTKKEVLDELKNKIRRRDNARYAVETVEKQLADLMPKPSEERIQIDKELEEQDDRFWREFNRLVG